MTSLTGYVEAVNWLLALTVDFSNLWKHCCQCRIFL